MEDNTIKVDAGGGREERVRVNYPANSQKAQRLREVKSEEKEPVEKVVTGTVVQKKRGIMARVFGDFVAEDSHTVFGYVVTEVLIPAAKNAISDAVSQGIERVLFGDSKPRSSASRPSYTNYATRYVRGRQEDPRPPMSREARARHDFSDIILAQRVDAEEVIDGLRNLIDQFDVATVSDLYDLVGLTGEFTDNKWGWTDLRGASVRAVRGGYLLNLPRTQPIT